LISLLFWKALLKLPLSGGCLNFQEKYISYTAMSQTLSQCTLFRDKALSAQGGFLTSQR